MYTAAEVSAMLEAWKKRGDGKPEIIRELSESCLGWPYVYAAAGEMCTPSWRRNRMAYSNEKYAAAIKDNCPVLSGKQSSCSGCKWDGCRCFDCRGFTRWLLSQAGLSLAGGGATTQWETASNWAAKGEIKDIPQGLVSCVFKRKEGKMSHTGMYQGDGEIIHCSTTVKRDKLPGTPAWTHWGIPAGLYTDEELRKAGVNVSEGRNIPTLRRGSESDEVEELQALLNAKYGANLEIDGKFGAKTEAAVKAFQQAKGLAADGVVGPKTWQALGFTPGQGGSEKGDQPETGENERDRQVWDILYCAIGNPYGVAGLMGNLQAESGINPENLQNTGNRTLGMSDAEYTAAVDNGTYSAEQFINDGYGYGIAQWTYYSRKANLLNFAVGNNCSIGNLEMQIAFLLAEMCLYKAVWNAVINAASVREASDAVMTGYEKPANQSEENKQRRAELGQKIFEQFADVGNMPDDGTDAPDSNDEEIADGVWIAVDDWRTLKAAFAAAEHVIRKYGGE